MNKILMTFFFLGSLIPFLNGQCKGIIKNETDEFNGKKVILVGDQRALGFTFVGTKCDNCNAIGRYAIGSTGDDYFIRLNMLMSSVWSCNAGNTVEIKFKDNTVLNLSTSNSELSSKVNNTMMDQSGFIFCNISKEEYEKIKLVEMDKIRIQLTSKYLIARAKGNDILEYTSCFDKLIK